MHSPCTFEVKPATTLVTDITTAIYHAILLSRSCTLHETESVTARIVEAFKVTVSWVLPRRYEALRMNAWLRSNFWSYGDSTCGRLGW